MGNYLTTLTSLIVILHAVRQFICNRRIARLDEDRSRYTIYLDVSLVLGLICNAFDSETVLAGIPFIIMLALTAIFILSASVMEFRKSRLIVQAIMILEILLGIYHLLSGLDLIHSLSRSVYLMASVLSACLLVCYFMYCIYSRLRNIKLVIRSGNVWNNLSLSLDTIYILLIVVTVALEVAAAHYTSMSGKILSLIFTLLYSSLYLALGIRMLNGTLFIFMSDHERKIIESMKISHTDSRAEKPGLNLMYKSLYDRVTEYFKEEKPYLNTNLTINDIVEVVFSNRLYISKAIGQYTGRNFCQFVNYYRIMHAIELFRENTGLKVQELASKSGFNSSVSFGMAFRLFMDERPGDWCRRERYRLERQKK